jgi:hypothetical protein
LEASLHEMDFGLWYLCISIGGGGGEEVGN